MGRAGVLGQERARAVNIDTKKMRWTQEKLAKMSIEADIYVIFALN